MILLKYKKTKLIHASDEELELLQKMLEDKSKLMRDLMYDATTTTQMDACKRTSEMLMLMAKHLKSTPKDIRHGI